MPEEIAIQQSQAAAQNKALHERAVDTEATFWIEKVLPLALIATDDAEFNDGLDDFIDDLDELLIGQLATAINLSSVIAAVTDDEDESNLRELFIDTVRMQERFGFLCYARAPEATRGTRGVSVRYGISRARWFYDEDLTGIVAQAEAWAKSLEKVAPEASPAQPPDGGGATKAEGS